MHTGIKIRFFFVEIILRVHSATTRPTVNEYVIFFFENIKLRAELWRFVIRT